MRIFSFGFLVAVLLALGGSLNLSAQKVFMTGDSHVFSKIYPEVVEEVLRSRHPDMEFSWWAKNGICFHHFNSNPEYFDSIFAFGPDILLVHLGTNGAYTNSFSRPKFRKEVENFYATIKGALPGVKVVFITPFTNKIKRFRNKGKWRVNLKNREVSDEIIRFADGHQDTFVIDNNAEVGMKFLKSPRLIRHDNVHLTEAGYHELGTMVGKEILEIPDLWSSSQSPSLVSL